MIGNNWAFYPSVIPGPCKHIKVSRGIQRAMEGYFNDQTWWRLSEDWAERVYSIDCNTLYVYCKYKTTGDTEHVFKVDTLNYEPW
jgi:hypothetical protein